MTFKLYNRNHEKVEFGEFYLDRPTQKLSDKLTELMNYMYRATLISRKQLAKPVDGVTATALYRGADDTDYAVKETNYGAFLIYIV